MADQVNPLGGLASGMSQSLQALAAPLMSSPLPPKPVEPTLKAEEEPATAAPQQNLEAAVKSVEDFLQQSPSDLKFLVDNDTGLYYFKIINPDTHETIRQVPSEEILAMARKLQELSDTKDASGILMDEQG